MASAPPTYKRRLSDRAIDATMTAIAYKKAAPAIARQTEIALAAADFTTEFEEQRFNIRVAGTADSITSASMLVQKMYSTRGYPPNPIKGGRMKFTLIASQLDQVVGTVTLGLDAGDGLAADQLYQDNIDDLRREGLRVCELTKLAIDHRACSKYIFGGLLHMAFIYANRIYQYSDVVMEVVPRHTNYYVKMLDCEVIGVEKLNPRVNFPVNLLRLNGPHVDEMIQLYGGQGEAANTRTLYAYFFSKIDEEGIMQRLLHGE